MIKYFNFDYFYSMVIKSIVNFIMDYSVLNNY